MAGRSQMVRAPATSTWQARTGQREGEEHVASQRVQEMRIVRSKVQSEEDRKSLRELYELVSSQASVTAVQWMEEEEVLSAQSQLGKGSALSVAQRCIYIYVVTPFRGAVFEVLKEAKVPIFSPSCVMASICQGISLPRYYSRAIFSLALHRVNVCCSNMSTEARDEVYRMVEEMAGVTNKALTASCSHLITPVVGSIKYFAATEAGMKVMMPGWVGEVYKLAKSGQDNADKLEQLSRRFITPIFAGCYVSVSQLSQEHRTKIKALMKEHGGRYDKDLTKATVTHLICDVWLGDKCQAASNWKTPVVRSQWVHDSVRKGYCLDYRKYALTNPKGAPAGDVSDNRVDSSSGSKSSQRALTPDHVRQGPNGVRATSTPHKNAQRLDIELDISAIDKQVKLEDGAAPVQVKKEVLQAIVENEEQGENSSPQAKPGPAEAVKREAPAVADENGVSTTDGFRRPSLQASNSPPQAQAHPSPPAAPAAAAAAVLDISVVEVESKDIKAERLERVEEAAVAPCPTLLLARRVMALAGVQENNRSGTASVLSVNSSAKSTPASSQTSAAPPVVDSISAPTGSKEVAQLRIQQEMAQLRDQLKMAKVATTGHGGKIGRLTRRPSNKGKKSPGRKDRGQVCWSQHERNPFMKGEGGGNVKEEEGGEDDTEEEYEEASDYDEVVEEVPVVVAPPPAARLPVKPPPPMATTTSSIVPLLRQAAPAMPATKKGPPQGQPQPVAETVARPKRQVSIVDLDKEEEVAAAGKTTSQKVFILSGISNEGEKSQIFEAIRALGGRFIDTIQLSPQATHLLVKAPAKNEKFYGCCATGRFILHPSYIVDSAKAGRYLPEEKYEWGNVDHASHLLLNLDDNNMKLAKAAHRWRIHVSKGLPPAFMGWTVLVVAESPVRGDGYIRMLTAGGATVLPNTPPLLQYVKRATHLLYESGKVAVSRQEIEAFEAQGVICGRPETLSQYITDQTPAMIPPHLRKPNDAAVPPVKRSRL